MSHFFKIWILLHTDTLVLAAYGDTFGVVLALTFAELRTQTLNGVARVYFEKNAFKCFRIPSRYIQCLVIIARNATPPQLW